MPLAFAHCGCPGLAVSAVPAKISVRIPAVQACARSRRLDAICVGCISDGKPPYIECGSCPSSRRRYIAGSMHCASRHFVTVLESVHKLLWFSATAYQERFFRQEANIIEKACSTTGTGKVLAHVPL